MSSAAKARREDKNKNYAQQMQDFANDSVNFFNKCAKPDKTGKLSPPLFRRVHEDLAGLRHGLPRDRVHRLYHQARVHPHQQHHHRSRMSTCLSSSCFANPSSHHTVRLLTCLTSSLLAM